MAKVLQSVFRKKTSPTSYRPMQECLLDKRTKFPCFLHVMPAAIFHLENDTGKATDNDQTEAVVFVEKKLDLKFVRIEVIDVPFHKQAEGNKEELRSHLVGQEMLIPLTYSGHVTQVNRSFQRKIYNTFAEFPDPAPSFVTLEVDCILHIYNDQGADLVLTRTRFEVVEVMRDEEPHMILRKKNGKLYIIKEDTLFKFSLIPTRQSSALNTFVSSISLPRLVTFDDVRMDSLLIQDERAFDLLTAVFSGPIKLKTVESVKCFPAWTEIPGEYCNTPKAFFIPEKAGKEIWSKKMDKKQKALVIAMFEDCDFVKFAADKLYVKGVSQNAISQVGKITMETKERDSSYAVGAVARVSKHLCDDVSNESEPVDHDYVNFPSLSRRLQVTSLSESQQADLTNPPQVAFCS